MRERHKDIESERDRHKNIYIEREKMYFYRNSVEPTNFSLFFVETMKNDFFANQRYLLNNNYDYKLTNIQK